MNKQFKNEIFIEGFLESYDFEKNTFNLKNNDEIIQFKYREDFKFELLEEVKSNEIIKIKGSIDIDGNEIFLLAKDILLLPIKEESEESYE